MTHVLYQQTGNKVKNPGADVSTFSLPTKKFPDPNDYGGDMAAYLTAYNGFKADVIVALGQLKKWHLGLENKGEIVVLHSLLPIVDGGSKDTNAQRSIKTRLTFKADNGTGVIETFSRTIGNAKYDPPLFAPGTETADLTAGEGLALKTAVELVAGHPDSGLPATLEEVSIV